MTTLVANTFNWVGLSGLSTWFKKLAAEIEQAHKIKQTIKELSQLTDRELNDIGLARGDIWAVAHGDESLERVRRDNIDTNDNLKGWV